jgi:hypothetical protein
VAVLRAVVMLAVADQLPVVMLGEIGASRPPSRSEPEPEASAGTASASKQNP